MAGAEGKRLVAAEKEYQLAMDLVEDPQVRAHFQRLRDEEAFHVDVLEGEYTRLERQVAR